MTDDTSATMQTVMRRMRADRDEAQARAYRLIREIEDRITEHQDAMLRANADALAEIERTALEERAAVLGWLAEIERDADVFRDAGAVIARLRARLAERWPDAAKRGA